MSSAIPIAEHPDFTAVAPAKSYPLPFWSGFFEKKHYHALGGGPVFLFGYLIDRTTKEDSTTTAAKVGIVLGGKPITDSAIAAHYGISTKAVARFRQVLLEHEYIGCQRTPYGYRYTIRKSKKFGIWGAKRSDKTVQSGCKEIGQKCPISEVEIRQNCPERSDKTVRNKEDHAVDHAVKQQPAALLQQGDLVWSFLGIEPCGPHPFRALLESCWSTRNGDLPSVVIGTTLNAWKDAEGANPPRCAPLFKVLAELRKRESSKAATKKPRVPIGDQMIPKR